MNSGVPSTLVVKSDLRVEARPKSPIRISLLTVLTKIFSHFMSLWIIGCGSYSCRYFNPDKIYLHHCLMIFNLGFFIRFRYFFSDPPLRHSVINIISFLLLFIHAFIKLIMFLWCRVFNREISSEIRLCSSNVFRKKKLNEDLMTGSVWKIIFC